MEAKTTDKIEIADFESLLNQEINIRFSNEIILPAKLIEVLVLGGYSPLERNPFSITVRTQQKTEYYQQGTYIMQHPILGEIYIFFVPLGMDKDGMKYEAVFS
jgi:hypothetical protein